MTATKLTDPNMPQLFNFTNPENPREATDEIDEIEPNSMVTIDQDFMVDEGAMEFSDGFLTLELMLSDPLTSIPRPVQKHQMRMQISDVYSLSPNPSYLLVVNSKTPNHAIHQIIVLLRNRLRTHLDIFNLSLIGSYISPIKHDNPLDDNKSVLNDYAGKSVIIFGNSFPFFNQGSKDPWDLLDPWETGLLIKGGTNLSFVGVGNLEGLKKWGENATFPAHDFTAGAQSFNDVDINEVVTNLRKPDSNLPTSQIATHRFAAKKSLFKSIEKSVDSAATSAAKKLNKNLPLRRFIAVPDLEATKEVEKMGGVIICEGLPKNSNMVASVGLFQASAQHIVPTISDYNMFFVLSCLPFVTRAKMFWNMIGKSDATGITCEIIYKELETMYSVPSNTIPANTMIDDKVNSSHNENMILHS